MVIYRDEHVKHKSDCLFVKLNKQDEKEWTVHEMYDLYKEYHIKKYVSTIVHMRVNSNYQLLFNLLYI